MRLPLRKLISLQGPSEICSIFFRHPWFTLFIHFMPNPLLEKSAY